VKENYHRCCGIDVHKANSVMVCVLPPVGQSRMGVKKRKIRSFTRDLKQLRAWLKNWLEQQIEAMEAEIERRVVEFEEPIQRLRTIPGLDRVAGRALRLLHYLASGQKISVFQSAGFG
jgi:hypothetical protein